MAYVDIAAKALQCLCVRRENTAVRMKIDDIVKEGGKARKRRAYGLLSFVQLKDVRRRVVRSPFAGHGVNDQGGDRVRITVGAGRFKRTAAVRQKRRKSAQC